MIDLNTPIWQLTVRELKELIESIIIVPVKSDIIEDSYYNSKEVLEYLKISKSTLARWTKTKYLKSEKFGSILRFKKSELDKVLISSK